VTHGERDGQADAEPVLDELEGLIDEMRGFFWGSREWQDHEMHEQVNQCAVNEAAKDGAANQECESAAGQIVDRRGTERDHEMQDDSKRGRLCATRKRLQAENTAGNELQNETGLAGTVHDDRVSEIQYTDNQPPTMMAGKGRGCARDEAARLPFIELAIRGLLFEFRCLLNHQVPLAWFAVYSPFR
jgi:hypothetical protein